MKFIAEINVMPQKALLDPQGKAVLQGMSALGLPNVTDVRIGKRISMELSAESEADAKQMVEKACNELLVNKVMEHFEYALIPLK